MLKKSKSLQVVVDVAQSKERDAAIAFGKSQNELNQQRTRLIELQSYLSEYKNRFNSSGEQGRIGFKVHSDIVFMENLHKAIKEQEKLIQAAEAQVEVKRELWLKCNGKTTAYTKLLKTQVQKEEKKIEQIEQKETDDRRLNTQHLKR